MNKVSVFYEDYNQESIGDMLEYCKTRFGHEIGVDIRDIMEIINPNSGLVFVGFVFDFITEEDKVEFVLSCL